jgi:hypothetical protein
MGDFCAHLGFGWAVDDSNTPLQAIVEGTLSTTTCENLGLDDHIITTNLLRDGLGLSASCRDSALGDANAILQQSAIV